MAPPGPLGFKTYQKNVKLQAGESIHYKPGMGFYAAPKAKTYKSPAPKPGASNPAPVDKAAAGKAAAVAATSTTAADLISQYNLAKAKILQEMAPQIQGIYSNATKDLTGAVGPLTQDVRSRLMGAGGEASADLGRQMGGLTSLGTDVTPSFNPDSTASAAYALGAAFPAESLAKQGAAFGAAASFIPAASLEQGQMALSKYLSDQKVSEDKQSAVNVGVSKLLGYVSDAQGHPITGPNGKPIRLPKGGRMTEYQAASVKLREATLKDAQASRAETARLRQAGLSQSDAHFVANMNFKTDQQKVKLLEQIKKGKAIDWTATKATGVIHLKDGSVPRQSNGHVYTWTAPPKPPTTAAISKAVGQGQAYLKSHTKGFYASALDQSKPLTVAQVSSMAKAAGMTVKAFLANDEAGRKAREQAGMGWSQVQQHQDNYIQDLYEQLVKVYRIPARRAFNMVAKYFPQWGKAKKPTYFPKGT